MNERVYAHTSMHVRFIHLKSLSLPIHYLHPPGYCQTAEEEHAQSPISALRRTTQIRRILPRHHWIHAMKAPPAMQLKLLTKMLPQKRRGCINMDDDSDHLSHAEPQYLVQKHWKCFVKQTASKALALSCSDEFTWSDSTSNYGFTSTTNPVRSLCTRAQAITDPHKLRIQLVHLAQ